MGWSWAVWRYTPALPRLAFSWKASCTSQTHFYLLCSTCRSWFCYHHSLCCRSHFTWVECLLSLLRGQSSLFSPTRRLSSYAAERKVWVLAFGWRLGHRLVAWLSLLWSHSFLEELSLFYSYERPNPAVNTDLARKAARGRLPSRWGA